MKRFSLLAITMIALISMGGCAARINNIMSSWVGHHYSELFVSWGPPQYVFDDGAGGRVLVWAATRTYIVPGKSTTYTTGSATVWDNYIWGSATSHTTYTPAQTYSWTAYRAFWIRRHGKIYRWAWRGYD